MPVRRRSWLGVGVRELTTSSAESRQSWLRPGAVVETICSSVLIRRLSLCIFLSSLGTGMIQSSFLLFLEVQLKIERREATWFFVIVATSALAVAVLLLRPLVRVMGPRRTLLVGLTMQFLANVLFVASSAAENLSTSRMFIIFGSVAAGFSTMNIPMIAAMKANAVPADMQGRIQGAIGAVQNCGMAIGPLVGGFMFSFFSQSRPSVGLRQPFYAAPFLSCACLLPIAIIVCVHVPASADSCVPVEHEQVAGQHREMDLNGVSDSN